MTHSRVANLTAAACAGLLLLSSLVLMGAGLPEERVEPRVDGYVDEAREAPGVTAPDAGPGMPPLAMVLVALGFIALGRRRWCAAAPHDPHGPRRCPG